MDNELEIGKIRMNKIMRGNIGSKSGNIAKIRLAEDVPFLTKIHVLPFEDTLHRITDE